MARPLIPRAVVQLRDRLGSRPPRSIARYGSSNAFGSSFIERSGLAVVSAPQRKAPRKIGRSASRVADSLDYPLRAISAESFLLTLTLHDVNLHLSFGAHLSNELCALDTLQNRIFRHHRLCLRQSYRSSCPSWLATS